MNMAIGMGTDDRSRQVKTPTSVKAEAVLGKFCGIFKISFLSFP